jgi:outer membrane receptor for ferrienterochelin and colicins
MKRLKKNMPATALALIMGFGLAAPVLAADISESKNTKAVSAEKMVVTAKSTQAIEDLGMSVSIVSADEIMSSNAESIDDILLEIAGINPGINSGSVSGRQNISIRGTASEHVLILVDGKKVSGSDAQIGHSDFQYNWVPMNAIERIEVIKGPMSSIYGSQAIGGVINIITKKSEDRFYGDVGVKYGGSSDDGGDMTDLTLNLGGRITDRLSMVVSGEHLDLDASEEVDEDGKTETKIEGKEITNGMVKLRFDPDATQHIEGSISLGTEDRYKIQDTLYYDIDRKNYSLGYNKQFDGATLALDAYVTDSDFHYNASKSYTHNMTDSVARAEVDIASFNNQFIVIGSEYKNEEYSKIYDSAENASGNFEDDVNTTSAFLQDEVQVGERLMLTFGTRYDYHEKFHGEFSPKISALYKIGTHHRLKAGYGEGFMAPTLTQGSSSYIKKHGSRITFYGNDDLKPENSRSYELGYEYHGDGTVFKSAVYRTEVEDLIDTTRTVVTGASPTEYIYSNVDSAIMQGFECEISRDITPAHNIRLGYHYLDTEDEETGEELSNRPEHTFNARLTSNFPWSIRATFSADYTGSQKDEEDEYDAFTLYKAQLSRVFYDHWTVRLGVDNITDEDPDDIPYSLKGRLVYAGVNYSF